MAPNSTDGSSTGPTPYAQPWTGISYSPQPQTLWPTAVGVITLLQGLSHLAFFVKYLALFSYCLIGGLAIPPEAGTLGIHGMAALLVGILMSVCGLLLIRRRPASSALGKLASWAAIVAAVPWACFVVWQAHGDSRSSMFPTQYFADRCLSIAVWLISELTYPIFLLVWLRRPRVRQQVRGWRKGK